MSLAKPNIAESRFGVDGTNADAANFAAPTSGDRDTGWTLDQVPASSVATYLQNKTYRWFLFLDEVFKVAGTAVADFKLTGAMAVTGTLTAGGALTVSSGGAAIAGTVAVTGAATVSTTLGVTGAATLGSAAITAGATVGTTLGVTGAATVGGTLGVTGVLTPSGGTSAFTANGLITAAAGVTVSTGQAVTLSGTTTLTAGGLITASAGVTAASGQHVTVSGTGEVKHGDRILSLPPHIGKQTGTVTISNTGIAITSGDLWLPIPLKEGDRIKSYAVNLLGNGTADLDITFWKIASNGTGTNLDTTTVNNQAASWSATTINPADVTIGANEMFLIQFTPNASGLTIGVTRMTYDRP